jgi:hypothetical protein
MVLPGWQEELEQLREKQGAADPPAVLPTLISAVVVQQSGGQQPALSSAEKETQEFPATGVIAQPQQDAETTPAFQADSARRELRVRVWEQEPTRQYPQVQVQVKKPEEMETRPALAVEHPPFTAAFEEEEEVALQAEATVIDWQALASSGTAYVSEAEKEESTQQVEEAEESKVEDLPTVPLAVPTAVKRPPAITIERASTPAPTEPDVSRQEIESQPTRPMPVSQVGPHASLPPVARQLAPGREEGQSPTRSFYGSQIPASPALPAASWQNAALALPPTRGAPVQAAHGPMSDLSPLAGQSFSPSSASMLQSPISSPGNALLQSLPPVTGQRSSTPTPTTPSSVSPRPIPASEPGKRRVAPLRVALLVGLIIVLGAAAFIVSYQATSGGTQAYQAFENSTLGVFLNYPQGWAFHLNQAQTSVHFADSSQTGQITLSRTAPGIQSLTQYLDQQITRQGIATPQFAPTRLFAGASWQQVQGNIVQQGVTYMLDLYVTRHGAYLYTLIFLAPPTAYGGMEQESFAPLRASFRFIQGQ